MATSRATRITILPVFRRHWVFYCHDAQEAPPVSGHVGERAAHYIASRAATKWEALQAAEDGTATAAVRDAVGRVLDASRDPDESFLGAVSRGEGDVVEVAYPASLPETLVRRRLRQLSRSRLREHLLGRRAWACASALLSPLLATPLTKWPLFYAAWRWRSHSAAFRGASRLRAARVVFAPSDDLAAPRLAPRPVLDADAADIVVGGSGPFVAHKVRWLRDRGLVPRDSAEEAPPAGGGVSSTRPAALACKDAPPLVTD